MWIFYALATLPIFIGLVLIFLDKKIVWQEWLIGAGVALVLAIIFNIVAVCNIHSKTDDVETWSGSITYAHHFARWEEYYEYAVYRTEYYDVSVSNSNGKGYHTEQRSREVFDHWQPTSCWHNDHWEEYSDINTTYNISNDRYSYIISKFGKEITVAGSRSTMEHNSRMIAGDPDDYQSVNITKWIEPITKLMHFENRVKATPNLFAFSKVPTNIPVYEWPSNPDYNHSQRLIGTARSFIDPLKFDQLNSILGASKKVNLILIGYGSRGIEYGHYQESKFFGGKKNDLVLTFGNDKNKVTWAYVFGFTEQNIVKHNLETILLTTPLNNDILSKIEVEVHKNYVIKNWHKFEYIEIKPADWVYFWYFGLMCLLQSCLYTFYHFSDFKDVFQRQSNFGIYNRYGKRRF